METYYKVCRVKQTGRKDGGETVISCWITGDAQQLYRKNQWNRAKVGGFLVFTNLVEAKDWTGSSTSYRKNGYRIFECQVKNEVDLPSGRLGYVYEDEILDLVRQVWSGEHIANSTWPDHTKAFKSVKLVREIMG